MCGRFVLETNVAQLVKTYRLATAPDLVPRYNIAPGQQVAVVRQNHDDQRQLVTMRWGLIPAWAREPSVGSRMINARSETVHEKPSFRQAFRTRRCIIPASGFYEWQHARGGKIPHYFFLLDGQVMSLAGLWEKWKDPRGQEIESCTILTTAANAIIKPFHDRMPVILHGDEFDLWLDRNVDEDGRLAELFHPYPSDLLTTHPVALAVNKPGHDDPSCILPLERASGE